jgi:hypothetical protein
MGLLRIGGILNDGMHVISLSGKLNRLLIDAVVVAPHLWNYDGARKARVGG